MASAFQFAYPHYMMYGALVLVGAYGIRYLLYKPTTLYYSLVSELSRHVASPGERSYQKMVTGLLRLGFFLLLVCALGRPQKIDHYNKVHVEGIDIVIALDASGSMQCFDDVGNRRSRFDVAKQEAIRFAQKRTNDQIGLVLFGKEAVTRCPLTLDKRIIEDIIQGLEIGVVDPEATVLSVGLAMAIRRLESSKAKSKVVILLTDGEPSQEFDIDPQIAIDLARKLGVKVYTVGVGGAEGGLIMDPFFGVRPVGLKVNKELLAHIAQQTGGTFFMAEKPEDMGKIYNEIDRLEKTKTEAPLFARYSELMFYPLIGAVILYILLMFLQAFVWIRI